MKLQFSEIWESATEIPGKQLLEYYLKGDRDERREATIELHRRLDIFDNSVEEKGKVGKGGEREKVEVDKSFLVELKTGIIEAISTEDGLDGVDGMYLISRLNTLLGLSSKFVEYLLNSRWWKSEYNKG